MKTSVAIAIDKLVEAEDKLRKLQQTAKNTPQAAQYTAQAFQSITERFNRFGQNIKDVYDNILSIDGKKVSFDIEYGSILDLFDDNVNTEKEIKAFKQLKDNFSDSKWRLYAEFLKKQDDFEDTLPSSILSEITVPYQQIKDEMEAILFALRNWNDDILTSKNIADHKEVSSYIKDNEGRLERNLSPEHAKMLIQQLDKVQQRLYFLGAVIGVNDERSNIQTQINKRKKYIQAAEDNSSVIDGLKYIKEEVEFFKQYGTVQLQKYAINQEYDRKIAEAQKTAASEEEKQWKVRSLQKERQAAVASANAKDLAMGIDWGTAFEGIGNVLSDIARQTLDKVEAYMKSSEFAKLPAESKKAYADLRQQLLKETGGDSTSPFNFRIYSQIAQQVRAYRQAVRNLTDKTQEHSRAVNDLEDAEKKLSQATDDTSKAVAQRSVDIARGVASSTAAEQQKAQQDADKAKADLTDSTSKAANGINNFSSYLAEMSNGSLAGFANGISKLITSLGKGSDGIGKSLGELGGKTGGIVGAILQIIDALGDDPTKFINDLFDKITNTVETILSDLPNLIGNILKDVGNLILGIVEGIGSMFGLEAGWITGSNAKEVKETIDRLTERNKNLQQAIEDLTDELKSEKGAKAISTSDNTLKLIDETIANYLAIAQAQAGYHASHHSWQYYFDGFTSEQIARLSSQIGRTWDGSLWNLSPEEMKKLRSNVDMWEAIGSAGKGDYGEKVQEKLNDYIAQAGKVEDITNQLYETLTTTTKENVFDDALNSLYELANGSEDVFNDIDDNWQKMVNKMAVNNTLGQALQDRLSSWWEQLAKVQRSYANGDITADVYRAQMQQMKAEYDDAINDAKRQVDALRDAGIVKAVDDSSSSSQTGKSGSFTTLTQDQGTKLEGLFTNNLRHLSSIDAQLPGMAQQMTLAEGHLARIAANSEYLRKLDDIAQDIQKIRRDGVKAV